MILIFYWVVSKIILSEVIFLKYRIKLKKRFLNNFIKAGCYYIIF